MGGKPKGRGGGRGNRGSLIQQFGKQGFYSTTEVKTFNMQVLNSVRLIIILPLWNW